VFSAGLSAGGYFGDGAVGSGKAGPAVVRPGLRARGDAGTDRPSRRLRLRVDEEDPIRRASPSRQGL
jgi:hypothetical protein